MQKKKGNRQGGVPGMGDDVERERPCWESREAGQRGRQGGRAKQRTLRGLTDGLGQFFD